MRHKTLIGLDYSPPASSIGHAATSMKQRQHSTLLFPAKQTDMNYVVAQKAAPGVIILGKDGDILFVWGISNETSNLLDRSQGSPVDREERDRFITLLKHLRLAVLAGGASIKKAQHPQRTTLLFIAKETNLSCRGLLLKGVGMDSLVMILVENLERERRQFPSVRIPYFFSPRERAVVQYIKKGFTNKEIAVALGIGVHTVKDHIKRIMKKMDVHTRTAIVGKINGQADS